VHAPHRHTALVLALALHELAAAGGNHNAGLAAGTRWHSPGRDDDAVRDSRRRAVPGPAGW
jgi:hypothetical protein